MYSREPLLLHSHSGRFLQSDWNVCLQTALTMDGKKPQVQKRSIVVSVIIITIIVFMILFL